jgi:hypothetical protein
MDVHLNWIDLILARSFFDTILVSDQLFLCSWQIHSLADIAEGMTWNSFCSVES